MKKYGYFVLSIALLSSCTQKPAEVVQKGGNIYNPSYSEVYVESPDGKIARSLRGHNDSSKAQEISIINKNAIKETNNLQNTAYYTVKSGDSLWSISKKYNMAVPELVSLNNLKKPYNIRPNQKLIVSNDNNTQVVKVKKIDTYTVKSGDNLSTIANKFDMKTVELAELNNIERPYKIRVGQKLKVNATSTTNTTNTTTKQTIGTYIVKSGDNLSTIASKNNMSLDEIAKLNNIKKPYTLRAGQKLKINKNTVVVAQNTQKQAVQEKPTTTTKPVISNTNKKNSFMWPVKGEIVSTFGNKANGLYNDGINISASKGTNFKATEDGVVAYVGNELRGYGTIILIKHSDNWISAYAHCGSVKVARGDRVQKGQTIGTVGQTGNVSSPQLYFSLRSGREAVDPIKYLE